MKIYIIGTSNSIMGRNGFIKSLSMVFDVESNSVGRAPIFMHISEVLRARDEIEKCDFLLIDHISNYSFFDELGSDYIKHLENFYRILSTLNTYVIILGFPLLNSNVTYENYLKESKKIAAKNQLEFVDLSFMSGHPNMFIDNAHINKKASFMLGLILNTALKRNTLECKPVKGEIFSQPYETRRPKQLSGSETETFSTSILKKEYLEIDADLVVNTDENKILLALGYICTGVSGFNLNGTNYIYSDKGYFFEAFSKKINHCGVLRFSTISPLIESFQHMMPRPNFAFKPEEITKFKLVSLFFFDEEVKLKVTPSNKNNLDFSSTISTAFQYLLEQELIVNQDVVESIKNLAFEKQTVNPKLSLEILKLAKEYRPNGPAINSAINDLKKKFNLE